MTETNHQQLGATVPDDQLRPPERTGAPERRPPWVTVVAGAWLALFAGYVAWLLLGARGDHIPRDLWLSSALLLIATVLVALRAVVIRTDRFAWALLAAGMAVWTASDVYYTAVVSHLDPQPYPSVADWGYLAFTPFALAAIVLLLRRRIVHPPTGVWLDGLLVACGAGAFLSLMVPSITRGISPQPAELFMTIATPGGDLILACLLAGAIGLLGLRAGSSWWLLLAGAVILWAADSLWLIGEATGEYLVGGPLDALWPLSMAALAVAAWRVPVSAAREIEDHALSALPLIVVVACFGLMVVATFVPLPWFAVTMAVAAVVVGGWRSVRAIRTASIHAELRRQAYLDDLTGLANRRRLTVEIGQGPAPAGALLLIDIDGFKQVNDSLGHAAGDEVLRQLAPRLLDAVRGDDIVTRLGGDEFAVFLMGAEHEDRAMAVAERLRAMASEPMRVHGVDLEIDLSIGIAMSHLHGSTLEQLLRASDGAMYRSKHSRSGPTVFEPELDSADRGHLLFLQQLRHALVSDDVTCVYQPKIHLASGAPVGVEALVRWRHPERGEIGPAAFLAFAEQTALIKPLTTRVLDVAVGQLGEWAESGLDVAMSVNLSPTNLMDPELPAIVAELLARHRAPSGRLILEVTESVLLADPDRAKAVIAELRAMGVLISIDDFGTGFSALGQIRTLSAQELKLDMSFVIGVAARRDLQTIVAATVLIAHGLGLQLVAEGIESQADLDVLTGLDCDLGQGYFICPPMAPVDAGVWLRRRVANSRAVPRPRADRDLSRQLGDQLER